jgi:hypothetical protein
MGSRGPLKSSDEKGIESCTPLVYSCDESVRVSDGSMRAVGVERNAL